MSFNIKNARITDNTAVAVFIYIRDVLNSCFKYRFPVFWRRSDNVTFC